MSGLVEDHAETPWGRLLSMLHGRRPKGNGFATLGQGDAKAVKNFVDAAYRLILKRSALDDQGAELYVASLLAERLTIIQFVEGLLHSEEAQRSKQSSAFKIESSEALRSSALKVVEAAGYPSSSGDSFKVSPAVADIVQSQLAELVLQVVDAQRLKSGGSSPR